MNEVYDALDELIDAITDSDEYIQYHRAKKALDEDMELRIKVDEFRRRNFELQNSQLEPGKLMEELDRFEYENEEFRSIPKVHNFLECELALIKMMQMIYSELISSIDFN